MNFLRFFQIFIDNCWVIGDTDFCNSLIMPSLDIHVKTQIPDYFMAVLKGEKLWEPGIPEDLEALH